MHPLNHQTWAELAAFTNNVEKYKRIAAWVGSDNIDRMHVLDFAKKYACADIVEYLTPRTHVVTCSIAQYTIKWTLTTYADKVERSVEITGTLTDQELAQAMRVCEMSKQPRASMISDFEHSGVISEAFTKLACICT